MDTELTRLLAIKLKEISKNINDEAESLIISTETPDETQARYDIGGGGIPNPTRPRR